MAHQIFFADRERFIFNLGDCSRTRHRTPRDNRSANEGSERVNASGAWYSSVPMRRFNPFATVLDALSWQEITAALEQRASTARGREYCTHLPFLDSALEVEESLARIEEARDLLRRDERMPMGSLDDVGEALRRAHKGAALDPETILRCAEVIRTAARVRRFLSGWRTQAPRLSRLGASLPDLSGLASRIDDAFEASGALKDTASDALASYRARSRQLHGELKDRVESMIHDTEFSLYVQDAYYTLRNDRYVLPIKASFRSKVPGIVHNASHSGQTLFIEPQPIVDLGNELSIAESLAAEEERQVLAELSSYLGDHAEDLDAALSRLALLDSIQAAARLAGELDAEPPILSEVDGGLSLGSARHPLLLLHKKSVVPNDIIIESGAQALVVSGPNAGGKTVAITTIGLCVLMVRAGLPIPAAKGSRLPLFDGICSAMGDAQDLSRDLSTFSAHLTALRDILDQAGRGWLVIVDEIAADTDPKEGAALATAMLEELVTRSAHVLVTTHLDEVKSLGLCDPRFTNARMGLDAQTLRPNYSLQLGAAGMSNAIEIAHQVGLPERVIERAREQLKTGGALSMALARLDAESARLEKELIAVEKTRDALDRERAEMSEEREAARLARREAQARVRQEMAAEIDKARSQVSGLIADLQKNASMAAVHKTQRELDSLAEVNERERARLDAEADVPKGVSSSQIRVGSLVRVLPLGRDGEVLALDDDGVVVGMGTLRSRVARRDLVVVGAPRKPGQSRAPGKRRRRDVEARPLEHPDAECDVRGLRADEALREVELFLDRCSYAGPSTVMIIHGHGTGALKRSIRAELQRLPYVGGFRPGEMHEGGDGVTVVDLRA